MNYDFTDSNATWMEEFKSYENKLKFAESDGKVGITKDEMIKAMQDPKFFAEAQAVLAEYATAKSQLRFERGQKAGTSRKKGTANDIG